MQFTNQDIVDTLNAMYPKKKYQLNGDTASFLNSKNERINVGKDIFDRLKNNIQNGLASI